MATPAGGAEVVAFVNRPPDVGRKRLLGRRQPHRARRHLPMQEAVPPAGRTVAFAQALKRRVALQPDCATVAGEGADHGARSLAAALANAGRARQRSRKPLIAGVSGIALAKLTAKL